MKKHDDIILNKVIIIGGNHYNGLNLARSFGINKIKPYGVIISENLKFAYITKSKYWEETWVVNNSNQAIELILERFSNEKIKPVIIPFSDDAAAAIDRNLVRLQESFFVPSINNEQGKIISLMNKKSQIEFANKYNIPMANSWVINLPNYTIPQECPLPCILKPVISFEGNKLDICKCNNLEELNNKLIELAKNGYTRILLQEYLRFDCECLYAGCCGSEISYFASCRERCWPEIGGTGSFVRIINDNAVKEFADKIIGALKCEGFSGLFDIEVFLINDRIYLNEINWRNTGRDFMCMGTKVHYAVIWYYSLVGRDASGLKHFFDENIEYAMDESIDLRHVVYGDLSLWKWLKDLKKAKSFSIWYSKDLKPVFFRYLELIKEMIRRGLNK